MNVEFEIKVIPLDENFAENSAKLTAEGYEMVPGIRPAVVFHVMKLAKPAQVQPASAMGAMGDLIVDETRIGVLKAGTDEITWGDGKKSKVGEPHPGGTQ